MLKSFFLILAVMFFGPSPTVVFADTPELSTYAREDFEAYKKSPFANPQWDPFVKEGFEAMDRQDIQSSVEFLRKAINVGCQSPLVYFKMALGYESFGSYYSAIQYYELAQKQFKQANQNHRYAQTFDENYGRALYLMGKQPEAVSILEKASRKNDTPWVLKLLGDIYMEQEDLLSATAYYERLLRHKDSGLTDQERIAINLLLARLYLKQGEKEAAQRYYEQILAIDPAHQEAHDFVNKKSLNIKSHLDDTFNKILDIIN